MLSFSKNLCPQRFHVFSHLPEQERSGGVHRQAHALFGGPADLFFMTFLERGFEPELIFDDCVRDFRSNMQLHLEVFVSQISCL